VEQSVGAGEDLDKGAEVGEPDNLAQVALAHFRLGHDLFDDALGLHRRFLVGGGDVHLAVVVDFDLGAGALDDRADHLAAGADDVADLLAVDHDADDPRGVLGDVLPGTLEGAQHVVQDVDPTLTGLAQRLLHDLAGDALDLEIHLDGGDALLTPGDLEVHVAVVVLFTGDVGEHRGAAAFVAHQTHGHAGDGSGERNTGIHQRQAAATDRSHGRGAVGLEDRARA